MNFTNLAKKRESCRSYTAQKVEKEDVIEILQTAMLAPSACNSQPWKFIVCTDETAQNMHKYIVAQELKINHWTADVPCFVIVCEIPAKLMKSLSVDSQYYAQLDIGHTAATLCYSASDKGISSCIIGVFDEERLKKDFNIPQDVKVREIIALGYAQCQEPRQKIRKTLQETVSFNQW